MPFYLRKKWPNKNFKKEKKKDASDDDMMAADETSSTGYSSSDDDNSSEHSSNTEYEQCVFNNRIVLDSGATMHLVNSRLASEVVSIPKGKRVRGISGKTLKITKQGKLGNIRVWTSDKIRVNILSLSKLIEENIELSEIQWKIFQSKIESESRVD